MKPPYSNHPLHAAIINAKDPIQTLNQGVADGQLIRCLVDRLYDPNVIKDTLRYCVENADFKADNFEVDFLQDTTDQLNDDSTTIVTLLFEYTDSFDDVVYIVSEQDEHGIGLASRSYTGAYANYDAWASEIKSQNIWLLERDLFERIDQLMSDPSIAAAVEQKPNLHLFSTSKLYLSLATAADPACELYQKYSEGYLELNYTERVHSKVRIERLVYQTPSLETSYADTVAYFVKLLESETHMTRAFEAADPDVAELIYIVRLNPDSLSHDTYGELIAVVGSFDDWIYQINNHDEWILESDLTNYVDFLFRNTKLNKQ
jgi:hypothetical protein